MKQTIYGNIVFLSTHTFNNSYIITLFQTYSKRKPPLTTSVDNAAQPLSQLSSSNLWHRFTAAQLFAYNI
jgi:hypothetical protein